MLPDDVISAYLLPLTSNQSECIRAIRAMIQEHCPNLVESIDEGKWFGGLLTYYWPEGMFVYALGPRSGGYTTLHMMPYYGSEALRERYGESLRRFQSGKSCVKFKKLGDVPRESVGGIFEATPAFIKVAQEMMAQRRK